MKKHTKMIVAMLIGIVVSQCAQASKSELGCLTRAAWIEARGRPMAEVAAVMYAIMNRTRSPVYPRTVCAVTHQKGQFPPQHASAPKKKDAHEHRRIQAFGALVYAGRIPDPTGGATHFWTPKLRKKLGYKGPPGWAGKMKRTARIGEFVFHRHSGSGQRPLRLRKIT